MIRKLWKLLQSFYRAYHTVKMTHADLDRAEVVNPWSERNYVDADPAKPMLTEFEIATACVKWGKAMRDRQRSKERLS